jgi:hypothetical protein
MKISELIEQLEAMKKEYGDLDVETYSASFDRMPHNGAVLDFRAILEGRERKQMFASWFRHGKDYDSRKGEAVCRL